jgi:hypothetical protein
MPKPRKSAKIVSREDAADLMLAGGLPGSIRVFETEIPGEFSVRNRSRVTGISKEVFVDMVRSMGNITIVDERSALGGFEIVFRVK